MRRQERLAELTHDVHGSTSFSPDIKTPSGLAVFIALSSCPLLLIAVVHSL